MSLRGSNSDVRREAKHMIALGWVYEGLTGSSHHRFRHPEYGIKNLPLTPSDVKWIRAHRRELAHLMGLSMAGLEERITGQSRGSASTAERKRRRRRGRQHRPVQITAAVEPDPVLPRIATLERGTPEFRREYMQLEADGLTPTDIRRLIAQGEAA